MPALVRTFFSNPDRAGKRPWSRTRTAELTAELSSVVSNVAAEATRVTCATRDHSDTAAARDQLDRTSSRSM